MGHRKLGLLLRAPLPRSIPGQRHPKNDLSYPMTVKTHLKTSPSIICKASPCFPPGPRVSESLSKSDYLPPHCLCTCSSDSSECLPPTFSS